MKSIKTVSAVLALSFMLAGCASKNDCSIIHVFGGCNSPTPNASVQDVDVQVVSKNTSANEVF